MVAVTLVPLIGPPDGVRSLIKRLIPAPEGRGIRRPVQERDLPFTVSSISCVCAVAGDVGQKRIGVGSRVPPVTRTDPDVLFCSRYPRGFGLVVREPGGGLQ